MLRLAIFTLFVILASAPNLAWPQSDSCAQFLTALPPKRLLLENETVSIYHLPGAEVPSPLFQSLGRERARTFAAIGEGSGAEIDLDRFDPKYDQLLAIERATGRIVGGYRVQVVSAKHWQSEDLYSYQQFHYSPEFFQRLGPYVLELGRSFVIPEWQKKGVLDLLWAGIARFILRQQEQGIVIANLIGAVSIPDSLPRPALELMIQYFGQVHGAEDLEHLVSPRQPLVMEAPSSPTLDIERLAELRSLSIRDLESQIQKVSPLASVPPLVRFYTSLLGAKFVAFDHDQEFHTYDGLIVVHLPSVSRRMLKQFFGERVDAYLDQHAKN